ncbi:hypothetical protein LTR53_007330 [Teratosphaeriaceae sp. CCFEE 6253]|nr:hypothetical protein LTR53_007330 [Teratosphaeriaceae sp. CCFEE 6253]
METSDVLSLVEDMSTNIDDLEAALAPILKTALSASTSKLPLLDKAKMYVLATYAIESILFSALRLNGTDAKAHPVFAELGRVKGYFAKIKTSEDAGAKRSTVVDKDAAGRFIKHGLAGNEKYDRERAGAKRKLEDIATGTHTRFDGAAKRIKADEKAVAVVRAGDVEEEDQVTDAKPEHLPTDKQRRRKSRRKEREASGVSAQPSNGGTIAADGSAGVDKDYGQGVAITPGAVPAQQPSGGEGEVSQDLPQASMNQAEGKKSKKKRRKGRAEAQRALEDTRAAEML